MYDCFSLVLMVTHACNLRCGYCYTGRKFARPMSPKVGRTAIDRAILSISPQGTFELGFFGGEPLLEARLVAELIERAGNRAAEAGVRLRPGITTNGTRSGEDAWRVMTWPGMQLTVSHDGLAEAHDRHRRDSQGRGTSDRVLATIGRLLDAGRDVRVNMVVRPDTVALLPEGITHLREQGIRHVDTSLDLWARWNRHDAQALQRALVRCADLWQSGLPDCSISWFDEKAIELTGVGVTRTARCGFGDGELAVAPSGNLYPCERLIGEDRPNQPMRLPGHALNGADFCRRRRHELPTTSCSACAIGHHCNTTCRCSNYVRTGDVHRPDGLLCLLNTVLCRETARILCKLQMTCASPLSS